MVLEDSPGVTTYLLGLIVLKRGIHPVSECLVVRHAVLIVICDKIRILRIYSCIRDYCEDKHTVCLVKAVLLEVHAVQVKLERLGLHLVYDHGGCLPGLRIHRRPSYFTHGRDGIIVEGRDVLVQVCLRLLRHDGCPGRLSSHRVHVGEWRSVFDLPVGRVLHGPRHVHRDVVGRVPRDV